MLDEYRVDMAPYLRRGLEGRLRQRLTVDSVVVLEGARATGKSSLIREGFSQGWLQDVRSFTDETELAAARAAPRDYVNSLVAGTAIDEVQLFEEITLAIKDRIDTDETPGQLVLTGSTRLHRNALGGSDPLAGRMQRSLVLGPLTAGERSGQPVNLLAELVMNDPSEIEVVGHFSRSDLATFVSVPGLPGLFELPAVQRQNRIEQYLTSVTSLQAFESRNVQNLTSLARYLANRTATLINVSDFAQRVEIARQTTNDYLSNLEEALLVQTLPAWTASKDKSEGLRGKIHFFDAGVAGGLGRLDPVGDADALGRLAETFVVNEMSRQAMWVEQPPELFHWRHKQRDEVDLVVEWADGMVVCIEVKSAEKVGLSDFRGIDAFRQKYPDRFHRGFVFYSGDVVLPFGEDRWAIPFGALGPAELERQDPVGAMLDNIAAQRAASSAELDQGAAVVQGIADEVMTQLSRIGESLGYPYDLVVGERSPMWNLQVEGPDGSRSLLKFDLDLHSGVLRLHTYSSKRPTVGKNFAERVDTSTPEQLVAELLSTAETELATTLIDWDIKSRPTR